MQLPDRPDILVLPKPSLYRQLFSPAADAILKSLGKVVFHSEERDLASRELAERIGEFDIVITGWQSSHH